MFPSHSHNLAANWSSTGVVMRLLIFIASYRIITVRRISAFNRRMLQKEVTGEFVRCAVYGDEMRKKLRDDTQEDAAYDLNVEAELMIRNIKS